MAWERQDTKRMIHEPDGIRYNLYELWDEIMQNAKFHGLEWEFVHLYKRYRRSNHDIYTSIICAAGTWDILNAGQRILYAGQFRTRRVSAPLKRR